MIASEIERSFQPTDPIFRRHCRRQRRELLLQTFRALNILSDERPEYLHTNLRDDTSDRENAARRTGAQRVKQHGPVPRHHRKMTWAKLNHLMKSSNIIRAVFHTDDVRMFTQ